MPLSREVELGELPAPLEPLTPAIHPQNKDLLEQELKKRAELLGSILSKRELSKLQSRYAKIAKMLRKAKWNDLCVKRYQLLEQVKALKAKYDKKPTKALLERGRAVANEGKALIAHMKQFEPLVKEFEDIKRRLNAHEISQAYAKQDEENRQKFKKEAQTWEEQIKAVFKQSARLHHVRTDTKGRTIIDIPIIERVVFKEDRVLYQVKTMGQTMIEKLLGKWHSVLPYNVDVPSLTSDITLENLSSATGRVVQVERSKTGVNLFYSISRLDSSDGIPNRLLYQKAIDWYPVKDHAKTPWIAGVTKDRKIEFYTFEDLPHVLIAGSTQGGKSNHVNQMIATLCTMNTPEELRVVLVDLKGGIEFTHWRGLAHQLRPMATTPEKVLNELKYLRGVMEKRLKAFESAKAKNLSSFNAKNPNNKLPRIILFVDEMATLIGLGDLTTDIHGELRVLSAQGRAVGLHLVLCTQDPRVDILPGWVKTNMSLRISSPMPSITASQIILDTITAATLPKIAGRMVFSAGRTEVIAQSPFISDDEIARAVTISGNMPKPLIGEFTEEPIAVKKEFTEYDFIEGCLQHLNGRLSANRLHDALGGNDFMPIRKLRYIFDDIIEQYAITGIEHNGIKYSIKKERTAYMLVEQSVEHDFIQNQAS